MLLVDAVTNITFADNITPSLYMEIDDSQHIIGNGYSMHSQSSTKVSFLVSIHLALKFPVSSLPTR